MLQDTGHRRALALVSCLVSSLCLSSCGTTSPKTRADYAEWTERERAAEVKRLREKAEQLRQRFAGSRGENVEALHERADVLGETVKIYPSATKCPRCYAMYGESLWDLAIYYQTLYLKQEEVAAQKPQLRDELLQKAEKNKKLFQDFGRRAQRQFDIYFASGARADLERIYIAAIDNAARLENYMAALQYLDDLERILRPPAERVESTKKWLERQRRNLKGRYNRQQEEKLRAELEEGRR